MLEIQRVIGRGDAGPVLLVPHNLDYPGLDGVLVWQQAGVWKALLIQATLSPRHAGSTGSRALIAFWIACLESQGVQRDNIGLLFCPKPEDHLYRHEQAGDLGVAQYSMSWTPGAVNGKRTPAEALHSIDEYFRYGGVEATCMLSEFSKTELTAFAAWRGVECKVSQSEQTMISIAAIIIEEFESSTGACCCQ